MKQRKMLQNYSGSQTVAPEFAAELATEFEYEVAEATID
jgi:hypothetical protein